MLPGMAAARMLRVQAHQGESEEAKRLRAEGDLVVEVPGLRIVIPRTRTEKAAADESESGVRAIAARSEYL